MTDEETREYTFWSAIGNSFGSIGKIFDFLSTLVENMFKVTLSLLDLVKVAIVMIAIGGIVYLVFYQPDLGLPF